MGVSEAPAEAPSREILDVPTGVVKQAAAVSHSIASGLTPPDLLALFKMDFDDPAAAGSSIRAGTSGPFGGRRDF